MINQGKREYTLFSHSHKYSRFDLFLIAKPLITKVTDCKMRTIALTDHAEVELCVKSESDIGGGSRWRMNTSMLKDKKI